MKQKKFKFKYKIKDKIFIILYVSHLIVIIIYYLLIHSLNFRFSIFSKNVELFDSTSEFCFSLVSVS